MYPVIMKRQAKSLSRARELGITAPFLGGDGWDSPKLLEIAGAEALNGTFFTNHYSIEDASPASKSFVDAFKKEYGQNPDAVAVLAYDAVYVMVDAIKRAGSTEPAKIREALAATKDFAGAAGTLTLNATHDAVKGAVIIGFKDGKQVYQTTVNP